MMTYYRLALKERQTSNWIWKSTVLTSLEAVLHLLKLYSPIPAERIRVFSSTCKEQMVEMLNRENNDLTSGSLTAGEFLRERCLLVQGTSAQEMEEKTERRSTAIAIDSSMREDRHASQSAHTSSMGLLDQRRLQIELGSGGDHDTPYHFSLPMSTPQLLAWTKLLGKVQAGELQS
jgi:hypothetical protein